jgi:acylphosphatase
MPGPKLTRRLLIEGRVQGVGFRWALTAEATALGLKGWVRNRQDGSVEALIHGTTDAVEALTVWAWHGPSSARVDRVLSNDEPGATDEWEKYPGGFRQRATF